NQGFQGFENQEKGQAGFRKEPLIFLDFRAYSAQKSARCQPKSQPKKGTKKQGGRSASGDRAFRAAPFGAWGTGWFSRMVPWARVCRRGLGGGWGRERENGQGNGGFGGRVGRK
ncbi:MAG: hypothetical protein K6U74_08660, partial [Firmicutes bacterium]|nr:hypothetical protein [Bacillota bacterium]